MRAGCAKAREHQPDQARRNVSLAYGLLTIGDSAFQACPLAGISIPGSVSSIGNAAFRRCSQLASLMISNGVTSIGPSAFSDCSRLTSITIPASITNLGGSAFSACAGLKSAFFEADAPAADSSVFLGDTNATVYYVQGTTGWGPTFAGRPTALWLPRILTGDSNFGVQNKQFGFNISWASDKIVVIEGTTDLTKGAWAPISTNTLTSGTSYFGDPLWPNYPTRFYRVRAQ